MNLSFQFARRHGVLLIAEDTPGAPPLVLARNDARLAAVLEAQRLTGRPAGVRRVSDDEFDRRLQSTFEARQSACGALASDLGDDLASAADLLREPADLLESADDAPIIRFINAILAEAIRENASDIHIEPFEQRLLVRMRIDGMLHEVSEPPSAVAPVLVSRIKIMARLDIAEKRVPQDGRISLRVANRPVDVRVSTMPAGHGERVVLRLLDKQAGRLSLEEIGMDESTMRELDRLIHMPHGIFLVTGPTGSGKTTTLYAAMMRVKDATRNVMTVEDPIEYYIDGIAQSQVSARTGMTFARGLRAILRQDPDVVMVGEIRDLETARIAIQASLTGHVVFSTLHTNTAIGAVTRLRDMGTEPYLLASSLLGVVAQRLVRVLCPACKAPGRLTPEQAALLGAGALSGTEAWHAVGCPDCSGVGYRGRTAIYELAAIDARLREMIHDGAPEHALVAHARATSPGIAEIGRRKVAAGITSADELIRVTRTL